MVGRPRRQYGPWRHLFSGAGGDRRHHYAELRRTNATAAILVVSVIIFFCGLPIAYHAAKCGIDIDLLTRGAGFGYIGSTITSLIYASFTFIFFALEAVILAAALEMCFGIPRPIGYLISAVVIIPLVTYGITLISRFQLWTQLVLGESCGAFRCAYW